MKRKLVIILGLLLAIGLNTYADVAQSDTTLRRKIHDYGLKGFDFLQDKIDLDSARYYLTKAIDLQIATADYGIDDRIANNYILLAVYYRMVYNNTEALRCLSEAEQILKENNPNHISHASLYHNKGNIYKESGDLYMTKEYYDYSLDFLIENGFENTNQYVFVFSNYVKLLIELEDYDNAIQLLSNVRMDKIDDDHIKHKLHTTYAITYSQLGHHDMALMHFKTAEELIKEDKDDYQYINQMLAFYYALIDFYILYEEYDQALTKCDIAFKYIESLESNSTKGKITFECDIIYRAASIHYRKDEMDQALRKANQGIKKLESFLLEISLGNKEEALKKEHTSSIPDLLVLKSRILYYKYLEVLDEELLDVSYATYKRAIELLNHMKLTMGVESSKLYATSQVIEIYSEAVQVALRLYNKTNDRSYLDQSFHFAESSKAFALYTEIKKIEAMQFSDLDAEKKEMEKTLMGEIQAYEELIYGEQLSEEPDKEKISDYKEKLFHLQDDYNDLMVSIENENSNYYELKYNPSFVSLNEAQEKLSYKDALIEYVLSDSLLITYVIDKRGIETFQQTIEPGFEEECMELYKLMDDQHFNRDVKQNFRRYVNLGRKFYTILIEPALEFTDRKNLTIVPDGAIAYLPFEILLNAEVDTSYIDYMHLPYLIRDYSIGYSHSSTLLFTKQAKKEPMYDKVLAFAPSYENPYADIDPQDSRQIRDEDITLVPLVGTIQEVQGLKDIVPADVYLNELATESSFKNNAHKYRILHLAMHTLMRDDNPMHSMMAFTNEDTLYEGDNDNRLYAYEVYGQALNADLTVLSSCSSGFGKMQRGEGMMSLARGFIYSGCPSIVMTLWQVADKSSSELVVLFYKYLKRGKSKQEALRLAKLEYLDGADDLTSNPYFWAGFVVLGDNSAIYPKTSSVYWMILILAFVSGAIFIQFKRRKKSS